MKSIRLSSTRAGVPTSLFQCPSCGRETPGEFCGNCGEKQICDEDYSIRHYLKEIILALTPLQSKLMRTLWLLVSKPGFLSYEYLHGRRVRYTKPLQLFLFLNVVYYFSITLFTATTFTTPLATQLHMNNYYPGYASRRVDHKLEKEKISYASFEAKYNEKTSVLSKTLIFILIPIFGLLFYAFFFKKRKYFVEHLVVATHFWCFNLILLGVVLPIISLTLIWISKAIHASAAYVSDDGIESAVLQIIFGLYLFFMLRKAFGASWWYCGITASVIAWSFFHIVWLYRFVLFEVTLRMV